MKFHGIQLQEGSAVKNMTVDSGTEFPSTPSEGELFYRSDDDDLIRGLYAFIKGQWDRISSTASITVPSGGSAPSTANVGDLHFNTDTRALEVFDGTDWVVSVTTQSLPDPVAMALIFGN